MLSMCVWYTNPVYEHSIIKEERMLFLERRQQLSSTTGIASGSSTVCVCGTQCVTQHASQSRELD